MGFTPTDLTIRNSGGVFSVLAQPSPHDNALVLRSHFMSITWSRGLAPSDWFETNKGSLAAPLFVKLPYRSESARTTHVF